uniref:Uncharacterized protein n=1 Tax=Arundo donax TaxID=35708 RepID=A0A0A9DCB8_ARUDO
MNKCDLRREGTNMKRSDNFEHSDLMSQLEQPSFPSYRLQVVTSSIWHTTQQQFTCIIW